MHAYTLHVFHKASYEANKLKYLLTMLLCLYKYL